MKERKLDKNGKRVISFNLKDETIKNLHQYVYGDYDNKSNMSVVLENAIIEYIDKNKKNPIDAKQDFQEGE